MFPIGYTILVLRIKVSRRQQVRVLKFVMRPAEVVFLPFFLVMKGEASVVYGGFFVLYERRR